MRVLGATLYPINPETMSVTGDDIDTEYTVSTKIIGEEHMAGDWTVGAVMDLLEERAGKAEKALREYGAAQVAWAQTESEKEVRRVHALACASAAGELAGKSEDVREMQVEAALRKDDRYVVAKNAQKRYIRRDAPRVCVRVTSLSKQISFESFSKLN